MLYGKRSSQGILHSAHSLYEGCGWHGYWLCSSKRSCQRTAAIAACLYINLMHFKVHVKTDLLPIFSFWHIKRVVNPTPGFSVDGRTLTTIITCLLACWFPTYPVTMHFSSPYSFLLASTMELLWRYSHRLVSEASSSSHYRCDIASDASSSSHYRSSLASDSSTSSLYKYLLVCDAPSSSQLSFRLVSDDL